MSKITAQVPSVPPALDASADAQVLPPDIDVSTSARGKSPLRRVLLALSSLRLTVALLAFSTLLVFFGTLAQMDEGLWTVLQNYFRTWGIAWIPNMTLVRFGQVFLGVSKDATLAGSFPLPGGRMIGVVMAVNLLAAYAVRFRYTWKRAGIPLLHSGIFLLMFGELYTGMYASEGRMRIRTGQASNFVEDHRKVELAVVDPSDAKEDAVVVVPGSMLREGANIQDERLPFDVEVVRYLENSTVPDKPRPDQQNPATAGYGVANVVDKAPLATGVEGSNSDHPAAYVRLKEKGSGRVLGTYLVTTWLTELDDLTQDVPLGGKTYQLALRPERTYKPYTFHLKEFRHDVYPGTEIPKNYSSLVALNDPSRGEDREVKIYMNSPLRYEGETFYQAGVLPGDSGTILQVVRNRSWLAPYFACAMVACGLLYHFGVMLVGFLRSIDDRSLSVVRSLPAGRYIWWVYWLMAWGHFVHLIWQGNPKKTDAPLTTAGRYLPWFAFGLGSLYLLIAAIPPEDRADQMHLARFGQLPVMEDGRVKPMDSVARNGLLAVSNRQELRDASGHMRPATQWLLDSLTNGEKFREIAQKNPKFILQGDKDQVFRIENEEVLALLGLENRPGNYRYSLQEIGPKWTVFLAEYDKVRRSDPNRRTLYQEKVMELGERIHVYEKLTELGTLRVVPPDRPEGEWEPLGGDPHKRSPEQAATARAYADVLLAYATNNTSAFNTAVDEYQDHLLRLAPGAVSTARFETFFNHFEPFYHCLVLYGIALVLTFGSWVAVGSGRAEWAQTLNRTAFWLIGLAVIVQTFGILARMWIMDRPAPITNLYSTAVVIGWSAVLVGMLLERLFHLGIGNAVAGVLGFATMIIAHHLAHGDTMANLQAVLDTNFWLATHVTTINFGYAATFVAGLLGMFYIAIRAAAVLTTGRPLDPGTPLAKVLSQMIYGIVCFALFLSFVGTVLGGLWADWSWGRFWGWDPKENGALLIVLMNAIVLHARWGGIVKQQGIAMLTVAGMMVTGWSWFGTNQLGVGLHAYGFNKTLAFGLTCFWAFEMFTLAAAFATLILEKRHEAGRRPALGA